MGHSSSGMNCSSMSPVLACEVTSPAILKPVQDPLHRFTDPDRTLLHYQLRAGSKPPSDIHLLQHGVLCGPQMDLCSAVHHHRLQGHSCLAMVFNTVCRGTSGPAAGAPPAPSSLPLVFAGLFYSHSSVAWLQILLCDNCFLSQVRYSIVLSLWPMASALAGVWSVLKLTWIRHVQCEGGSSQLLKEAAAASPPLPKPCRANPMQSGLVMLGLFEGDAL